MTENFDIWKLLAGLGIFMFGMFLMEEAIKKLSGKAFKKIIRRYTNGKVKSIFSGIFTTSILQSSSAVSLMVLAFVGAGIMAMENAIGVILGSNLGTTVTAWIVATIGFKLNIESFALPLIGSGGLGLIFFGKSEKYSNISKLLVGFGFLFMGLDYMKNSVEGFTQNFDISQIPDYGIVTYLFAGILLTAVMQSSSATIAIVLTALYAEILTFNAAAAMVIGANIGTTVTVLLGAIGAVQVKKRVAYSHLVFNVITGVVAIVLLPVLTLIVEGVVDISSDAVIGLALFHTLFNLLGVIIFIPFINLLARLLNNLFPDFKAELTLYINNTTPDIPEAALAALNKECLYLIRNALKHNLGILSIEEKLVFTPRDGAENKLSSTLSLEKKYENLKLLQAEIFTFSSRIQTNELSEIESQALQRYLHSARMALHSSKTLKDIKHDFEAFENADSSFLNDQYTLFRKRLIETYLKIDGILEGSPSKDLTKSIFKTLKQINKDDKQFVLLITQATQKKKIEEINLSTAIIVNRAFVQSSRQILLAIRELLLTENEIIQFEKFQELEDVLVEID